MNPAAVDTDEDAVGDRSPGRVLGSAIKTHFITLSRPESLEYLHDVSLGGSRHLHSFPGDLQREVQVVKLTLTVRRLWCDVGS